jgi:hypothetical protein
MKYLKFKRGRLRDFWGAADVTPCRSVGVYRRFGRMYQRVWSKNKRCKLAFGRFFVRTLTDIRLN